MSDDRLNELAPCPHEHAQRALGMNVVPLSVGNAPRWHVRCLDCGASGPRAGTEADAVAAWNRRSALEPSPAMPPKASDPHFYQLSNGSFAPYPHGMTEDEWNTKIGEPSYERAKDLPSD